MAYNNPIHFPIHPQQVSSFSSLGVTSIQCPPSGDNRIHVPIIQWTPSSKWKKTVIGPSSSGRIIAFDVSGTPAGYGAGVGDLTAYSNSMLSQMIRKGNDAVFSHTRDRKITLCINWPGYEKLEWLESINLFPLGTPITRSQLAAIVADRYIHFIAKASTAPSSEANWRVSASLPGKLILVALHNVFDEIWQADVVIDTSGR